MIELKIDVSNVDYDAAAELLLPAVIEQMGRSQDSPIWSRVLLNSQDFSRSAAKVVLSKMSKEKKDELLVKYINKNSGQLIRAFTDMLASRGLRVDITEVHAENKE